MNIYFSGLGGVGIGPLVEVALDAGYTVQGSDRAESKFTKILEERGIGISLNQDGSFLEACHSAQPIDWLVYTAALPQDHSELAKARELGIKISKRDELLARIIAEKNLKLIAISGTHGKTTTTSMLVWAFKQHNIPVSYSIGTTISFGPSGQYTPDSKYFIYECDEFDRNFLQFSPYLAIIASLGYDHADVYPTPEAYAAAFHQFSSQSQHTIMWARDNDAARIPPDHAWLLQDSEVLALSLPGAHYRRNATLVVKALERLEIGTPESRIQALNTFPGTSRRFERITDNLYTDYAVHPTEIAATLEMARELSSHVVVVYQPHQNTRQHEIKKDYTTCFEKAETIYWLPTYLTREDPQLPLLSPQELTKNIANQQAVQFADMNPDLWAKIEAARNENKLVLVMGAGTIDSWVRMQLAV
jgi:UDP-N-acetylmuramate--alanine ligase